MVRGDRTCGQDANPRGLGAFENLAGRRLSPFEIRTDPSVNCPAFSQLRTCAGSE
jgi:hypothetical protein